MQLVVNAFTENRLKLSLMDMFCHSVFVQALQLMEYMFVLVSSTMELKVIVFGGDNIVKNTQTNYAPMFSLMNTQVSVLDKRLVHLHFQPGYS